MHIRELEKIDRQLQAEAIKQMNIIFPSTAIALFKYYDWGSLKIEHLFDEVAKVYDECSDSGLEVSMLQMCDEQIGINLKADANGKSWKELCFLNNQITLGSPNKSKITPTQLYAMRMQQIKWVAPAVMAAVLIALYKKFRFSRPMLSDLLSCIDKTRQQYNFKASRLLEECYSLTGIKMKDGKMTSRKEKQ